MRCPGCRSIESRVVDTDKDHRSIYRRRKCRVCGRLWSTREVTQDELDRLLEAAAIVESAMRGMTK